MTETATSQYAYDQVPYPGCADRESHVRNLEAVATLFGLAPPPVNECRVLELGTASGRNLIPQAHDYPDSSFLGVDLADEQIASGQQAIAALGLDNIELRHAGITSIDSSWGQFDYIICPGVFSWVAPEVQDNILAVCRENLAPGGIAMVSYNVFPGWLFFRAARDIMRYHTQSFDDPQRQIAEARNVIHFLAEHCPADSAHGQTYREVQTLLRGAFDHYVYHEYLVNDNRPLYFHEFAKRAEGQGLRFVAEANYSTMAAPFATDPVRAALENSPPVARWQLLDFLNNATYRKSLLCHRGAPAARELTPGQLGRIHVSLAREPEPAEFDVAGTTPVTFKLRHGGMTTASPLGKAALRHLLDIRPHAVSLADLHAAALAMLPDGVRGTGDEGPEGFDALAKSMIGLLGADMLYPSIHPPHFVGSVSERPFAAPVSRYYAASRDYLTNQLHETVRLDSLHTHILCQLDGEHDRASVLDSVRRAIAAGELSGEKDGRPLSEFSADQLAELIERSLTRICRHALLIG